MSAALTYGSVCSGIGSEHVAWAPLGWRAAFFAELAGFPAAVLAERFPDVPNLGDFTAIGERDVEPVELLVGGTPCQSFSVAGRRLGLDDPRGNLALELLALARRLRPRWLVWENVGGVLSSFSGAPDDRDIPLGGEWSGPEAYDLSAFLAAAGDGGYFGAWRVLDAQYVRVDGYPGAVPQRRRRLFVVLHLGDWRPAAAVLLEPEGLRRDPPPRRETAQDVAGTLAASSARRGGTPAADGADGGLVAAFGGNNTGGAIDVATACNAKGGTGRSDFETETLLVAAPLCRANHAADQLSRESHLVAYTLRAEGFDASEDGTGRRSPLIPVMASGCGNANSAGIGRDGDPAFALDTTAAQAIAFHARQDPDCGDVTHPLDTDGSSIDICDGWVVRRLTPLECERLQGLPDDHTRIPWRGKPAGQCPDGPRYAAIGNGFPVNVLRWIGRRIELFEQVAGGR